MSKEMEARFSALERSHRAKIEDLEKRLAERDKRDKEAAFAEQLATKEKEGRRFVNWLFRTGKIHSYQQDAVFGEYAQVAEDDLRHPREVQFSAEDGTKKAGTRVEALEARYSAMPGNGLTAELIPDREEQFASFDSAARAGNAVDKRQVERMLGASSFAADIKKSRNGTANGKGA